MTEHEPTELNLEIARRTFPIGLHVTATVTLIPRPGAVGLFVDLGQPPWGFVDAAYLPESPEQWPAVGTITEFEVVHHTHDGHQVRLLPLDPAPPARRVSSTWQARTLVHQSQLPSRRGRTACSLIITAIGDEPAELSPYRPKSAVHGGSALLSMQYVPPRGHDGSLRRDVRGQPFHEKGEDLVAGRGGRLALRIDQMRGDHTVRAADDPRENGGGAGFAASAGSTRGSKRGPSAAA